jgi:hypothetical protein
MVAAPTPIKVERQPRTTPTPRTIVSASTISTALARKVPATIRTVLVLTARASFFARASCVRDAADALRPARRR